MESELMKRTTRPEWAKELGRKTKQAREAKNLSALELGRQIGISGQQIRRIEAGRAQVSAIVLGQIARKLGVSADVLLDHVRTVEEYASDLWEKHGLAKRIAGSRPVDFLAKKAILESMGLWKW